MKTFLRTILVVGLLLTVSASAGVRGVLGGGGIAEMKVLIALNQIRSFLGLYKLPEMEKDLSSMERNLVSLFASGGAGEELMKFEFFPSVNPHEGIGYSDASENTAHIPSHLIYDDNGVPLALGELWEVAFKALAFSPRVQAMVRSKGWSATDRAIHSLSLRIKDDLNSRASTQTNAFDEPPTKLHILTVAMGDRRSVSVMAELEGISADVTPSILIHLRASCPNPDAEVRMQSIRMDRAVQGTTNLGIEWICGQTTYQSTIWVSMKLLHALAPSVIAMSTAMTFYGKKEIRNQTICDDSLISKTQPDKT